jgi:Amt family ammonium transporter
MPVFRPALAAVTLLAASPALAQDATQAVAEQAAQPTTAELALFTANNTWMLVATALVFVMHLGFATLESGLTRAKNTVNILFKNVAIVGLGLLTYAVVGWGLMYPGSAHAGGVFAFGGWWLSPGETGQSFAYNAGKYTYYTDFIFQAMFAATAATIVSGAVAERVKLGPFLVFSTLYVAVIYPIVGYWHWGLGWLAARGFHDFAGSTIVHSIGGWGALAGVLVLGPRIGKFVRTPKGRDAVRPIMGHSMPLATIGVFLLWFGWFGFNGGSVLSGDPAAVSYVFVTTALAAAAGLFGAMATSWAISRTPDLSMTLNGVLAGLVGVTAGADVLSVPQAVLVGAIAGVLVVLAVLALDRVKLDDPVGAIPVHLVCGIWGTLAVGLFVEGKSALTQLIGIGATAGICLPAALAIFAALKYTVGLRVSREEELGGLDLGEHGMEAYSGFQFFTTE